MLTFSEPTYVSEPAGLCYTKQTKAVLLECSVCLQKATPLLRASPGDPDPHPVGPGLQDPTAFPVVWKRAAPRLAEWRPANCLSEVSLLPSK